MSSEKFRKNIRVTYPELHTQIMQECDNKVFRGELEYISRMTDTYYSIIRHACLMPKEIVSGYGHLWEYIQENEDQHHFWISLLRL